MDINYTMPVPGANNHKEVIVICLITDRENETPWRSGIRSSECRRIYSLEAVPPIILTLHYECVLKLMQRKILFAYCLRAPFLCSTLSEAQ